MSLDAVLILICKEQEYNYLTRHSSLATANISKFMKLDNQRVSSYNYNVRKEICMCIYKEDVVCTNVKLTILSFKIFQTSQMILNSKFLFTWFL